MTLIVVCSCIYVLIQCMLLLLEGIIINWYLSIVSYHIDVEDAGC